MDAGDHRRDRHHPDLDPQLTIGGRTALRAADRLFDDRVREALARVASPAPVRSLRQRTRAHALRAGRVCYDHLAGRLGTALMIALLDRGFSPAATARSGPDSMPAATTAVVEGAPAERAGLASGAINAARQVGGAIGVALLGSLVDNSAAFVPGLHIALIIAGTAFLTGAAVTALTVHRRPAER